MIHKFIEKAFTPQFIKSLSRVETDDMTVRSSGFVIVQSFIGNEDCVFTGCFKSIAELVGKEVRQAREFCQKEGFKNGSNRC